MNSGLGTFKFLPLTGHPRCLDSEINLGDSSVTEKCLGKSTQSKCLALENRGLNGIIGNTHTGRFGTAKGRLCHGS